GTPLGDPIELHALGDVFSVGRSSERPLLVASCKTNLGHMEAAAGLGGIAKLALQLQHSTVVPHLHFKVPSSKIRWNDIGVRVPTAPLTWPGGRRRIGGVSSFGISGTNAHVLLEEAPKTAVAADASTTTRSSELFVLSGKTDEAMRANAERLRAHL